MEKHENTKLASLINEDQFFFAIVITFLVFFLQYQEFDISSEILKPYNITIPPFVLVTTRTLFIILLLCSSVIRYLTVAFEDNKKKTQLRVLSANLLLFIPYYVIFDLSVRGLGGYLISSGNVFWLPITPLIQLGATYLLGRFIEKRWCRFYGFDARFSFGYLLFMILGLVFLYLYYLVIVVAAFLGIVLDLLSLVVFAGILTILTVYLADVIDSKYKLEKSFSKIKKIQNKIYNDQ